MYRREVTRFPWEWGVPLKRRVRRISVWVFFFNVHGRLNVCGSIDLIIDCVSSDYQLINYQFVTVNCFTTKGGKDGFVTQIQLLRVLPNFTLL